MLCADCSSLGSQSLFDPMASPVKCLFSEDLDSPRLKEDAKHLLYKRLAKSLFPDEKINPGGVQAEGPQSLILGTTRYPFLIIFSKVFTSKR